MNNIKEIIVVGGGAAGMMTAIAVAKEGAKVHLYEKNKKLGKKLFITGKGRRNMTNTCDAEELLVSVVSNSKFLYSSFYGFTNQDMMNLLERAGLRLKVKRGNRVFPQSDRPSDVIAALTLILKREEVRIHLQQRMEGLVIEDGICVGVRVGSHIHSEEGMIVTAGGLSYLTTGSTGDGYKWAKESRHEITDLSPALAAFEVKEADTVKELQGLSLKNVEAWISTGKEELFRDFGEMLFTYFGVSGPLLLSASSFRVKTIRKQPLGLVVDLKPALSTEQLDDRILRGFTKNTNKQFRNSPFHLYPSKLIPVIIARSGTDPDKKVNEVTKEERARLVKVAKGFTFILTGLRNYKGTIITQEGISVRDINPSTMESKQVRRLYSAGEILDLGVVTGGFSLQIAWSTGWAAGRGAALTQGQSGQGAGKRLKTRYKIGE